MIATRLNASITLMNEGVECMVGVILTVDLAEVLSEKSISELEEHLLEKCQNWKSIQIFHIEAA